MHQERGFQHQRDDDVRLDVEERRAREPKRVGDLQELVGHQRNVRRLERRV